MRTHQSEKILGAVSLAIGLILGAAALASTLILWGCVLASDEAPGSPAPIQLQTDAGRMVLVQVGELPDESYIRIDNAQVTAGGIRGGQAFDLCSGAAMLWIELDREEIAEFWYLASGSWPGHLTGERVE